MALMRSERELIKALKEYLYGDKKEREERQRKKKEEARKKEIEWMRQEELRSLRRVLEEQEEKSYKNLREELDKSIAKWERIALLLEQAVDEDEVVDEEKDQEVVHISIIWANNFFNNTYHQLSFICKNLFLTRLNNNLLLFTLNLYTNIHLRSMPF